MFTIVFAFGLFSLHVSVILHSSMMMRHFSTLPIPFINGRSPLFELKLSYCIVSSHTLVPYPHPTELMFGSEQNVLIISLSIEYKRGELTSALNFKIVLYQIEHRI